MPGILFKNHGSLDVLLSNISTNPIKVKNKQIVAHLFLKHNEDVLDINKFATFDETCPLFCEVRAFAYMLVLAVKTCVAETEHSEVSANALLRSDTDVRERTIGTRATSSVGKVNT